MRWTVRQPFMTPRHCMEHMYERLFELFIWENRDQIYRMRFTDGEEYELSDCFAGSDKGKAPYGTASIMRTINANTGESNPTGTAIFFHLSDIAEVVEMETEVRWV